jgi:hypothetical protein
MAHKVIEKAITSNSYYQSMKKNQLLNGASVWMTGGFH